MTDPDLAALIARAVGGDSVAFEEVVRRHHALVYRWAFVAAGDPDSADDVAQEVWIRVHRKLGTFQGNSKFTTWLYRIVFNTAVEGKRTEGRRSVEIQNWAKRADPAEATVDQTNDLDGKRLVEVVRATINNLPLRQRTVFAMADLEGIATAEIAERLEMNEVTVRANLFKARRAIRSRLLQDVPQLVKEYRE